ENTSGTEQSDEEVAASPSTPSGTEQQPSPVSTAAAKQRPRLAAPIPQLKSTAAVSELVSRLVKLETTDGYVTETQILAWKENLRTLVAQGANGVAAIQEFLAKNEDFEFGAAGKKLLGYASARLAMLDALAQIGGTSAIAVMTGTLQETGDPC